MSIPPLTPQEIIAIRRQFAATICTLDEARVYWLPTKRRITCRSLTCAAGHVFRVPDCAIFIGTYAHPYPAKSFVFKLLEVLKLHG